MQLPGQPYYKTLSGSFYAGCAGGPTRIRRRRSPATLPWGPRHGPRLERPSETPRLTVPGPRRATEDEGTPALPRRDERLRRTLLSLLCRHQRPREGPPLPRRGLPLPRGPQSLRRGPTHAPPERVTCCAHKLSPRGAVWARRGCDAQHGAVGRTRPAPRRPRPATRCPGPAAQRWTRGDQRHDQRHRRGTRKEMNGNG